MIIGARQFQAVLHFLGSINAQGCVAFLPCLPVTLKSLRIKEADFELRTVGEHIRRHRLELKLTQKQVALLLEVTEFSIINWEKDDWQPSSVFTLHRIVKFLGYDPLQTAPQTLGDRLRTRRREIGWGQRELAEHLSVDPKAVTHWERGGTILTLSHRMAVARFLGIEEQQLVTQMSTRWNISHGKLPAS